MHMYIYIYIERERLYVLYYATLHDMLAAVVHDDEVRAGHGHEGDLLVEDVVPRLDGEQALRVQDQDELLLRLQQGDVEALGAAADVRRERAPEEVVHQRALPAALHAS